MVLVFVETENGKVRKAGLEAVHFGYLTSQKMGLPCHALILGEGADASSLGLYGATTVHQISSNHFNRFDNQVFSDAIAKVAQHLAASVVVLSHSANGKSLIGQVAYHLGAGSVSAVIEIPETENGFIVKKGVFSSKALVKMEITSPIKVISVQGNAIQLNIVGTEIKVKPLEIPLVDPKIDVISVDKLQSNVAPLPEAERVVSGGRGLKGPENWGILEDLAQALNATTACSRPVADSDWRPHHEHVGQTGIAIRPNLYIAIGISGAIQHLAGVNNSKTIVVINKDPEAPFFKAANYGVVGDLFEVVPRLTAAIKSLNE
ncbi:MAG: electron transfer flavoprotein subunit alpha/FixB family protein [Bacteroidota bacterium]